MFKVLPLELTKFEAPNSLEQAISGLWRIDEIILKTIDIEELSEKIVNVMLEELDYLKFGYSIIVLSLVDKDSKKLKRISISKTPFAEEALRNSPIPFDKLDFNLEDTNNLSVRSLLEKKPYISDDLSDMLTPAIGRDVVRDVQSKLGVVSSISIPIYSKEKPLGTLILSLNKTENEITNFEKQILIGFSNAVGIAIEHAGLFKELNATNEKLKELDKQKDEFVSMAAHELRSPLTAIKGYISMIIEGDTGDIPEKARQYLADSMAVTDRLVRLVNNMLNVSRIEEGRIVYQIEETDLIRAVQEIYNSFRVEAERKDLEFKIDIPSGLEDMVKVDPDRVREVISNIVSNAIKFTEKGKVNIKMSNPKPGSVKVEVIDTGPGISKVEQVGLFQKFYRAESTSGKTFGTGLGLYITKLLIEKFGGEMGVTSELDKGSNFWFELPLVRRV